MARPFRSALVLTGDSDDDLALAACGLLAEHGLKVTAAGLSSSGALLNVSRRCRDVIPIASAREELEAAGPDVRRRARQAAESSGADLVFAGDIPGALLAARLRPELPGLRFFPAPDAETVRRLDDKWSFHRLLEEAGIPSPRTWLVESAEQAAALSLPLVLKPIRLGGGRGVRLVRDARALEAALGDPFLTPPFLAQELVEGEDVDLSFLAVDGELAAWAVQTRRADRTVDFFDDARVVQLGRGIAKAAHYTGLAHVDMRYTDAARSGVKVIECNPRIWLSAPLTLGLGVDFIGRGLALAAGEGPPPFAGAPADSCADLAGLARALGRRPLTACERAYLSHTLRDPLPVLYRRLRTVLGIAPGT